MNGFLIQSPVEHYADVAPDHPALCYETEELTYQQLDRRSNQLAHTLIQHGAKPQDRVAIYLHKSLEMGVAIYSILKAGCVFVPIDPFMPVDRLSFILKDCGIHHVITSDKLAGSAIEAYGKNVDLQNLNLYGASSVNSGVNTVSWDSVGKNKNTRPALNIIDQDLGYIMYTSGSTGVPKGMMHTHHGSISYARWGENHVSMTKNDRVASHAPLHFDLSIFDFFSTAQAGGTVVLIPEAVTRFPASWTKTIEDQRISIVFTVPYTLSSMLDQGAMDKRDLASLRWILYGGEPFPPKTLRRLMQALHDVKFTNVYGPAEAPSCTCYDIPLPEEGDNDPIPIGIVSRNSADIIIDDQQQDCSDGQEGELCIRSSTLTRGYWNRPDLNEAAYLYRPGFGPFPHVYFRTGDRVVRRSDGNLVFLGRVDRMIKVRGQRVELDEIESVLSGHPAVSEAAAFAVSDESGSNRILATVTLASDASTDETQLLRLARSQLSTYAVPTSIIISEALPHKSSGKIDRKQLAEQWLATHS